MAQPNPAVKGPGVLYVTSRIDRTDVLDEATYFKWYDEDHIDEIVHTSGMPSAFRYRDVDFDEKNKNKEKVYLAFYPMEDIAFTQGDEFRKIRVKSDLLPDTGIIYDLADLDVRYLGLVQKTESKKRESTGSPCLVVFGVEPGERSSDEQVQKWFMDEVSRRFSSICSMADMCSTYPQQPLSKDMCARHSTICSTRGPMRSQGH
jgi:hypothetical protein